MQLKVGDSAPLFELFNHEDEKISLANFNGRNKVILFFPLANTSTCTKEMCSIRDDIKQYEGLNAVVFGISVDSPPALRMWAEKHNLNFNLLSDFNKEVCQAYGSYYELFSPAKYAFNGVAKRAAFVVDSERIIRYVEVLENAGNEPDYKAIKEVLSNLNQQTGVANVTGR